MKRKNAISFLLAGLMMAVLSGPVQAALCKTCAFITGNNKVYAWDPPTQTLTTVVAVANGENLDSLIFDKNGNIIFNSDHNIYLFNVTTENTSVLVNVGSQLGDMALEPGGDSFLVASRGEGIIYRINLITKASSVFFSGEKPHGIIYDNTGKLFAALSENSVAQLDPATGAVIKRISAINTADGLTFSTTTLKLYAASNNGGFYAISTDLTSAVYTDLGDVLLDGIGTAGDMLYLINYSACGGSRGCGYGMQYNLATHTLVRNSPGIDRADDIAPLSGLGSQNPTPPPVLNNISPNTTAAGSPSFTMTLAGSQFVSGAAVTWNGTSLGAATFINSTQLQITVPANNVLNPGTASVRVVNPDGQPSNPVIFTITSGPVTPAPILDRLTPNTTSAGSPSFIMTVNGSQFASGATVLWNGSNLTTQFVSANQLTANVPASNVLFQGSANVQVINPDNRTSGTLPFTITSAPAAPVLTSIRVEPLSANRARGDVIAFQAFGYDQNNNPMSGITFSWSIQTTIDSTLNPASGAYQAGNTGTLPALDTITASAGGIQGQATVNVIAQSDGLTIISVTATPNPVPGTYTTVTVNATGPIAGYAWTVVSGPAAVVYDNPTSASSKATFSVPGVYILRVRVDSSVPGRPSLTGSVSVTVNRTVTRVTVEPDNISIPVGQTFNFQKHVLDQWGQEMSMETVTWTSSAGSIFGSGAFQSQVPEKLVTIRATSDTDPAISGTAQVRVFDANAAGSFDITNAYAYPVPWKSTMPVTFITFTGLAPDTHIRLFSTTGRLVQRLASVNGEDAHWYIDNTGGERVASGVYYYIVDNDHSGQHIKGKVVVIK